MLTGPVQVDPARHRAAEVGDEPLLLARFTPTVVSRDRAVGAEAARAAGASSIVMDDGFQSPGLHKDRSVLVVDARRGIGNGQVFPAGPLRAPPGDQLRRAQALLVVGAGTAGDSVAAAAQAHGLPVFHGRLEPDEQALAVLKGRPVLAFAGIGDPDKFFMTLRDAGIDVRVALPFADHHRYRRAQARELIERAERDGLVLVTTEKDLARLAGQDDVAALAALAQSLPVTLKVTEDDAFRNWVLT
jgi:tetraacyldisaccharide 4'-kinase